MTSGVVERPQTPSRLFARSTTPRRAHASFDDKTYFMAAGNQRATRKALSLPTLRLAFPPLVLYPTTTASPRWCPEDAISIRARKMPVARVGALCGATLWTGR